MLINRDTEKSGFSVQTADNGIRALEIATSEKIHLILLDITLPGINGEQVLSELRKMGYETPVIMVTADNDMEMTVNTFEMGADDYISKPFEMDELLVRVKAVIRRNFKT